MREIIRRNSETQKMHKTLEKNRDIVQHQCIIDPPRLGLHASFGGFFWPDSKLNAGGKP
jgi:hypothetical protein